MNVIAEYAVPIVIILFLVLLNALFVSAEFSIVGAKRSRLQGLAEGGNRAARWLLDMIDRPTGKDSYVAVAQLGITLASIGLGMYAEPAIAAWFHGPFAYWGLLEEAAHTAASIIALSAMTYLHVVFGEMIPKGLALQAPEATGVRVQPLMQLFGAVFRPFVALLNMTALGLMRMLGIKEPEKEAFLYSSKELAIVTEEVAASGQLDSRQQSLMTNIFELEERLAEELMTSRSRLEVISVDAIDAEVMEKIAASPRSRYPVYREGLDDIVGVLHIKDFMRARASGRQLSLARLARPLPSVAAVATAEDLLALFKRERSHAALVVDEFGGTLGLVTMDDLISDVMEEEDTPEEQWIVRNEDGSLTLDGEVTLSELREDEGLHLDHEDVTTVAGLFLAELGTVPAPGTTIHYQGHDLTAEEVQGLKVVRVRLRPLLEEAVRSPEE